ncbi:MAG: MBOAT family O-acyltransferase [Oscillospiraceae bacterium]|nr:MBOAT family O-acyltransferase [Oscillospiraceae bacterium]
MELGSLQFDIFICFALFLYWAKAQQKWRRSVLMAADFCFLYLCGLPTLVWCLFFILLGYLSSLLIERSEDRRKTGILCGSFMLALFFIAGYLLPHYFSTKLLSAIGMSYYALSFTGYLFDQSKDKVPVASFLDFFPFGGNFATILSGPVQSSDYLLQYKELPDFDENSFHEGVLYILWGFFQKTTVANGLGLSVDHHFTNYTVSSPARLLLASVFYSFQLYCDFAGYSYIAIGMGKLFGISVPANFERPYLATNIQDFWRRWHIGLSRWFREHVYFPLGGSRKGIYRTAVNTIIVFLVSGLWHGFGLNFIAWGLMHGLALALFGLMRPMLNKYGLLEKAEKNSILKWIARILNFAFVNLAWIVFRSGSLSVSLQYIKMLRGPYEFPSYLLTTMNLPEKKIISVFACLLLVFIVDLLSEHDRSPKKVILASPLLRNITFIILIALIAFFGNFELSGFLYYNF